MAVKLEVIEFRGIIGWCDVDFFGDPVLIGPIDGLGDTSNITIPSIFTTYTTAKLLTALLPQHVSLPFRRPDTPTPAAGPVPKSGRGGKKIEEEKVGLRVRWPLEKRNQAPPELQPAGTPAKSKKTTSVGGTATPTSPLAGSDAHLDSSHRSPISGGLDGAVFTANPDEGKPGDENDGKGGDKDGDIEKDGLWITLTPTSMSSSPFFDTLLVLVISPLVTLTIVYGKYLSSLFPFCCVDFSLTSQ